MPTAEPTILATSGGYKPGERLPLEFDSLVHYAVELAGTTGRAPRITHLGTAGGDQRHFNAMLSDAASVSGFDLTHLNLFPMPALPNMEEHLLEQDVVWVNGGSVANLLAVWRVHDLHRIFRKVWESGVVLAGVSAGSICWHSGGVTDSHGPDLKPVTNGLGLLPYANGVHYDSEERRRPLVQRLVTEGTLPTTYCSDDGVGLLYRGTELAEVLSERKGTEKHRPGGYVVTRDGPGAREEPLEARYLG